MKFNKSTISIACGLSVLLSPFTPALAFDTETITFGGSFNSVLPAWLWKKGGDFEAVKLDEAMATQITGSGTQSWILKDMADFVILSGVLDKEFLGGPNVSFVPLISIGTATENNFLSDETSTVELQVRGVNDSEQLPINDKEVLQLTLAGSYAASRKDVVSGKYELEYGNHTQSAFQAAQSEVKNQLVTLGIEAQDNWVQTHNRGIVGQMSSTNYGIQLHGRAYVIKEAKLIMGTDLPESWTATLPIIISYS